MNSQYLDIRTVCLKDLYLFAKGFSKPEDIGEISPINVTRARAQMKNPYAQKDDAVLFVAYNNGKCIGYLGQLPGLLATQQGNHRVFWGSTFYLMEKYRGKGIGKLLLDQMASFQQDFIVTRITPQAHRLLVRYGMKSFGKVNYYQLRVEKTHILDRIFYSPKKDKEFSHSESHSRMHMKMIGNYYYNLEKKLFYRAVLGFISKLVCNYQVYGFNKITVSDYFELRENSSSFFFRGPEVINWMLQNKWVCSQKYQKMEGLPYHFSDFRQFFSYIPLKIYSIKTKQYLGFMVICISSFKGKTILRILDNSLKDKGVIPKGCAVALTFAARYNADRVEFPDNMGQWLKEHIFFKRLIKKQKRDYLYFPRKKNSSLEKYREKILPDYCDGDTAFT